MAVCSPTLDVPTPDAAVLDLTGNLEKPTTFYVLKACIQLANECPEHADVWDLTGWIKVANESPEHADILATRRTWRDRPLADAGRVRGGPHGQL